MNYRFFLLKNFGSVFKPSQQTMISVIAVVATGIILGNAIVSGGLLSWLFFIVLGVSVLQAFPIRWLVFGAITLYQGFPLEVLDIGLLPESDINFRLSDLLLSVIFARSIFYWLYRRPNLRQKVQPDLRILAIIVLFFVWAFFSSIVLAVEGDTQLLKHMTSLGKVVLTISLTFYLAFVAQGSREVDMLLKSVVWWGVIQCIAGMLRWLPLILTGMDWVPTQLFTYDSTFWLATPSHPIIGGLATMTGLFGDPAKLGYWLVVALWAKVYFLRRKGGNATKGDLMQLGLLFLGLIATSRRGALIALVFSVLVYMLTTRQDLPSLRRVFRFPSLLVVAGVIFILAGFVIDPLRPLSDAFRITSDPNYGLGGRLDQSLVLWRDFLEKPFSGFGWMGNSLAGKTFWAASNYIFILADLGVIGLSLLLMLMASTLHQCWRTMQCHPKGSATREIYFFAFISFISIYTAMLSDVILIGGQPTLLLLGICLGVTARSAVWQE